MIGLSNSEIASIVYDAKRRFSIFTTSAAESSLDNWGETTSSRQTLYTMMVNEYDDHTAEEMHDLWRDAKENAGWVYGPVLDPVAKEDPDLVDFENLATDVQRRGETAVAIMGALKGA